MKSDLIGCVLTKDGRKAEVWLETGFDPDKCSFIMSIKFIDAETKQAIDAENIGDSLGSLEIGKTGDDKDISAEMEKLIKSLGTKKP